MQAMEAINNALNAHFSEIMLDGKYHHIEDGQKGKKPFWYIGTEFILNGENYYRVTCGDLRSGSKFFLTNQERDSLSIAQKRSMNQERDFQKKTAEIEGERITQECRNIWRPIWEELPTAKDHSYFREKKLSFIPDMVKIDERGTILIPLFDDQNFNGIQKIYNMNSNKPEEKPKFFKFFEEGSSPKGSFFPFGNVEKAELIYVAEGYATACSVFESTNIPTICCFNAGNIYSAIETIRIINKDCSIIIAADNDSHLEKNVGLEKANFAATKIAKVKVKHPLKHNDFNDLYAELGAQEVVKQLADSADFPDVICLGYKDDKSFYFTKHTKQLVPLSPAQHERHNFIKMMPSRYWGAKYRFLKDKEGNETEEADWRYVEERLQEAQGQKGFFNNNLIRGYGLWKDGGKYVYNCGESLLINEEKHPIFTNNLSSRYFYEANEDLNINLSDSLSDEQGLEIVNTFRKLLFKNKEDHVYLTGWIAQAFIFGVLDWRYGVWITGNKGNGKSTILKYISSLIPESVMFLGTTVSGIRQLLKNDSIPVIYDEAEADEKMMKDVMSLARQCSTNNGSIFARGSVGGSAIIYNTNAVFCMGSIQPSIINSADLSRFFTIEFKNTELQSRAEFNQVNSEMYKIAKYKNQLRARMIKLAPIVKDSVFVIKNCLETLSLVDARQSDQISAAVACYYHLFNQNIITPDDAFSIIENLNLGKSDYIDESKDDDSENCFNSIMQAFPNKQESSTIEMHLSKIIHLPCCVGLEDDLATMGIRYIKNLGQLFFSKSINLQKKTPYKNYMRILRRNKNFVKNGNCRMGSISKKGLFMKYDLLLSDEETQI